MKVFYVGYGVTPRGAAPYPFVMPQIYLTAFLGVTIIKVTYK